MIIGISGKIGVGKDTVGKIIQVLTCQPTALDNIEYINEDTINRKIWDNPKFEIRKFADKLKYIVCLLINYTREQLEDRELKEKELGEEWDMYEWSIREQDGLVTRGTFEEQSKFLGNYEITRIPLTPRKLLQLLGTECGRNIIHPNIWVNALMSEYVCSCGHRIPNEDGIEHVEFDTCKEPNWIITDVRFPNELKAVKDRGGISIRVNRNTCDCTVQEAQDCMKHCIKSAYQHPSETALDDAKFDYTIDNNNSIEQLVKEVKQILVNEKII